MRVLLTGGSGFIGSWIIRRLVARGISVRVFDRVGDHRFLDQLLGGQSSLVEWCIGDIEDAAALGAAAADCDHILHLAALLANICRDDPVRGARINLIGTLNVFEAARQRGIQGITYMSTAGVFGPESATIPQPSTHYGAFKLACEGSARAYWQDHGISSTGFRPTSVYGPGREVGLSAGPTLACRAAVRGEAYDIPFTGTVDLLYVDDVAAAFEAALLAGASGARCYNLLGRVTSIDELLTAIRAHVPDARIGARGPELPIHPRIVPDRHSEDFPSLTRTALARGIASTIDFYRGGNDWRS